MGRARRRFWWKARMNANDVGGFAISLALAQTQPEMSATQPSTGTPVGPAPAGPRVPGAAATPGATTTQQQSIAPGTGGGSTAPGGFNMIWMIFLFVIIMVVMTSLTG